jgi:hypothetical protein
MENACPLLKPHSGDVRPVVRLEEGTEKPSAYVLLTWGEAIYCTSDLAPLLKGD